jgi:hypothetical protein
MPKLGQEIQYRLEGNSLNLDERTQELACSSRAPKVR